MRKHLVETAALTTALLMIGFGTHGCGSDSSGDSDGTGPGGDSSLGDGGAAPGDGDASSGDGDGDATPGDGDGDGDGDGAGDGDGDINMPPTFDPEMPDSNGDGTVNILILGTSEPIRGGSDAFAPDVVASELESILMGDSSLSLPLNVASEDIVRSQDVTVRISSSSGDPVVVSYRAHSMMQYYYWPDGDEARHENLRGEGAVDWDHVIIASDPRLVARTPGYFALGVNKIAEEVRAGNAVPRLLMVWPSGGTDAPLEQIEEFTYRAAYGAAEPMRVVPAGLAWEALPEADQDTSGVHPTPNGAYLAAASIYAQIFGQSASESDYTYNDGIADVAQATVEAAEAETHYSGPVTHVSAFSRGTVAARPILYHETGTSSEAGIRGGLLRAATRVTFTHVADDAPFAHFNYGRANQYYEDDKDYDHDPSRFDYTFGFPMHDHRDVVQDPPLTGNQRMRYGMDPRVGFSLNDPTSTDLGIALYMDDEGQLPEGRAIPIRTLYAQAHEAFGLANPMAPEFPAHGDNVHMSGQLDTASGSFLYTILTGHCELADEPADTTNGHWIAQRTGYETAWTFMHLRRRAPCLRVIPESAESESVTPTQSATLDVSFANPPTHDVTVQMTTDNDSVVTISPTELVFTPENHATPQVVTMTGIAGPTGSDLYTVSATTSSADPDFNGFVDSWEFTAVRP